MANIKDFTPREIEAILSKNFQKTIQKKVRAYLHKKSILKLFFPVIKDLKQKEEQTTKRLQSPPIHPWRPCALGQHWVKTHDRKISKGITIVDGHCRDNPSKKDLLTADEIIKIGSQSFNNLKHHPNPKNLNYGKKGTQYDILIAGWTQYWNDIFKPADPITPNFIKALIASESGFNEKVVVAVGKSKTNKARGLMQITDQTIKILKNQKGELKDHLIIIDKSSVLNPSVNISSGIRWLFHKKFLAEKKMRKSLTWEESLIEYKGYMKDYLKNPNVSLKGLNVFKDHFKSLNNN